MGTWKMGERPDHRQTELAALRLGIDLGMTLIDTAEMYGEGQAEELVAEAIAGWRDKVFIVSKVYPFNASRRGAIDACERSLKRLRTDRIDLYLLHWRGSFPLTETVTAFELLRSRGKIRHWGVSNFDTGDMEELVNVTGGQFCASNQILYNLTRRGPEFDLLPWLSDRQIPSMAYSPIEQGRIGQSPALAAIALRHQVSPFQVALAWLLHRPDVIAIPKSGDIAHIRDNFAAASLTLAVNDRDALDRAFPTPRRKQPLSML
jgi:diketogulonate reductase-like aldo/keto reductase